MNLILLLLFATIVIKVSLSDDPTKCCGQEEVFVQNGNLFECTKDLNIREKIVTKNNECLKNSVCGSCFEVFNNEFVSYNISKNFLEKYNGGVFPKCCPVGSIYNSMLHSCTKNVSNSDYINQNFIKIGLPNCKIITDKYQTNIFQNLNRTFDSYCLDRSENGSFVLRECENDFEICNRVKCVKKCCPDGQSFINGSKCFDTYEHGVNLGVLSKNIENYNEQFAIIHNRTCRQIYKMSPKSKITLHKNGSFTEYVKTNHRTTDVTDQYSYCIEHSFRNNIEGFYFFHCFIENKDFSKFESRVWPLSLSCFFLVVTVLVYVVIKEYKKMFGKILINYCMTSFLLFGVLLWNQMTDRMTTAECQVKSFILIFFALAQFTWANVMSFEIWCTFGTTKLCMGPKHHEIELRKFLLYSLYAWGVPLLITLMVTLFYSWKILPDPIQPYLANKKCFFEYKQGNYAKFLFFSIPLLIIQIINMTFFVKTVIYCVKVKNEINKINDANRSYKAKKYQHDKERLFLILKLSIVMGISYIFEVVTGFFNMSQLGNVPKYTEIVLDIYNALQGVFIFIIFICKRKVLYACLIKLNLAVPQSINTASTRTQSSLTLNGVVLNNFGSRDKVNNNKL